MSCFVPIGGTAGIREAAVAREVEKLKRRVIWSERAGGSSWRPENTGGNPGNDKS